MARTAPTDYAAFVAEVDLKFADVMAKFGEFVMKAKDHRNTAEKNAGTLGIHTNDIAALRQDFNSLKDRLNVFMNAQARVTPTPSDPIDPNASS